MKPPRFTSPPAQLSAAIEIALNRLPRGEQGSDHWQGLAGRLLAIEFERVGWVITIAFRPHALHLVPVGGDQADTVLRGTPAALTRLARGSVAAGGVAIRGDVALARRFEQLLATADPDWEGLLAERIGDQAAYRVGSLAATADGYLRRAVESLQRNLHDGLLEEGGAVADRGEVDHFINEVDRLRDDAERLSARIDRLERRGGSNG